MAGLDGLKVDDLTHAEFAARDRIASAVDFVRAKLPGFENCLRRRRRAADGRAPDPAARGRVRHDQGRRGRARATSPTRVARGRDYYTRTARCCPRRVDQLLVAGRHYSATSAAQKISREIPPCMAMGEAAGVAAALALEAGIAVRDVDVGDILQGMRAQGADPATCPSAQRQPSTLAGGRRMTDRPACRSTGITRHRLHPGHAWARAATQMLADYGADVIKVERPGAGDLSLDLVADDPDGQDNPIFCSLNRNKRSVALDLRSEAGKASSEGLIADADVVVNNFRAGVMERMGFGYEELQAINPRIICAVGTGFGEPARTRTRAGRTCWRRR